jgi:hypothetical protein
LENLFLRHRLAVLARPTRGPPRRGGRDTLRGVLVRRLVPDGRRHVVLVTPDTVVGWHRRG